MGTITNLIFQISSMVVSFQLMVLVSKNKQPCNAD